MINTKELKNGYKCKIWISKTCPCGCESEGNVFTRTVIFNNGIFQDPKTFEVFGSSIIKYKLKR